jgi:tetratricopeptide (TPR) repeat protein
MSNTSEIKPLGSVLQYADLVSASQIKIALQQQIQSNHLKIGEILALRGWIKQETADFFAEHWPRLLSQKSKQPLGQYLKKAALLSEEQIGSILSQQGRIRLGLRFGELAILNGWLKPTTIDFFLKYFPPEGPSNRQQNSPLKSGPSYEMSNSLEVLRKKLLGNEQCGPFPLLKLYQQILLQGEVAADESDEQAELLKLGLVIRCQDKLKARRIYQAVFNICWLDRELASLDPYGKIKLKLLKLEEKASLPYRLLTEILSWTGNQSFLLQKLVQLLQESEWFIPPGKEAVQVERVVQTRIIENWETQAAGHHLKEIRDRFLHNQQCEPLCLVRLYQKILQQGEVPAENSQEEAELVNLGLLAKEEGKLKVANRIYQAVFNQTWLEGEFAKMIQPSKLAITRAVEEQPVLSLEATRIEPVADNQRNKTARWIVVLLILSGATLAGLKIFAPSREVKFFQQGNELLIQGIYQGAIAKYNQVLKINANYYQAWANRGYAFAGLQEYQKMLDSCTSATIIEPRAVYAWNCQGEALYNLKQYGQASATFDKAIALEPKKSLFWINKAESLLALKETARALEVIDKAIELLDSGKELQEEEKNRELSVAFSHKGQALWQKQEYEKALEAYDRALKYLPDYLTAQWGRGMVLGKLKRSDEALAAFSQMLNNQKLTSNQKAETWYYLGLTLDELSRTQEAIAAFDEALKLKPDYQAAAKRKIVGSSR